MYVLYATVVGIPVGDGVTVWEVIEVPLFLLLDPYIVLKLMFSQGEYVE
jgi:hypothetical protein